MSRKVENLYSMDNLRVHFLHPCIKDESTTITYKMYVEWYKIDNIVIQWPYNDHAQFDLAATWSPISYIRELYTRIRCAGGRWGSCIMLIIRSYITGKVPIMPRPYNIPWFNFANLSLGRLNGPNFWGAYPSVSSRPPTCNPPLQKGRQEGNIYTRSSEERLSYTRSDMST